MNILAMNEKPVIRNHFILSRIVTKTTIISTLCMIPGIYLGWLVYSDNLGPNPVEKLEHLSGDWAMYFLLASLAISPIVRIGKLPVIFYLRKIFGLFSFYYATAHFLTYLIFDASLNTGILIKDIIKRPYITAGFISFCILLLLAITSQRKWLPVAKRAWRKIHRLVYLGAGLSILHYIWLVKADHLEPLIYAGILGLLMLLRLFIYGRSALQPKS